MKNLEFKVDESTNSIIVKKEFSASQTTVWKAWTHPEILDKWWAPKPWQTDTQHLDFKQGGHWLYAMRGPAGEEHWSFAEYTSVTPQYNFKFSDGFCDIDGKINQDLPQSDWEISFLPMVSSTIVLIRIMHPDAENLQAILKMGFKEGFTMALENLEEILA